MEKYNGRVKFLFFGVSTRFDENKRVNKSGRDPYRYRKEMEVTRLFEYRDTIASLSQTERTKKAKQDEKAYVNDVKQRLQRDKGYVSLRITSDTFDSIVKKEKKKRRQKKKKGIKRRGKKCDVVSMQQGSEGYRLGTYGGDGASAPATYAHAAIS